MVSMTNNYKSWYVGGAKIVSADELLDNIYNSKYVVSIAEDFDRLDEDVIRLLFKAKTFNPILVVFVLNAGKSDFKLRCQTLSSIKCVDYVVPVENSKYALCNILEIVGPDILIRNVKDVTALLEYDICKSQDIKIVNSI